jgi:hypothetical protein
VQYLGSINTINIMNPSGSLKSKTAVWKTLHGSPLVSPQGTSSTHILRTIQPLRNGRYTFMRIWWPSSNYYTSPDIYHGYNIKSKLYIFFFATAVSHTALLLTAKMVASPSNKHDPLSTKNGASYCSRRSEVSPVSPLRISVPTY